MPQTVALLRARDGDLCGRGDGRIRFDVNGLHPDGPTIGHIQPYAHGGTDAMQNLRLEHRRCNLAAGSRPTPPMPRIAKPLLGLALLVMVTLPGWQHTPVRGWGCEPVVAFDGAPIVTCPVFSGSDLRSRKRLRAQNGAPVDYLRLNANRTLR